MENLYKLLITLLNAFILLPIYMSFSFGLTFYNYYYWFLLPIFNTLPHITYLGAVGISVFLSILKYKGAFTEYFVGATKVETKFNYLVYILIPWLSLLVGWILNFTLNCFK